MLLNAKKSQVFIFICKNQLSYCNVHLYSCVNFGSRPVLKVSQVACQLNVGHQTVLDWISRGVRSPDGSYRQLQAIKIGRSWRITEQSLEDFLSFSDEIEPPKPSRLSKKIQKKMKAELKQYWELVAKTDW